MDELLSLEQIKARKLEGYFLAVTEEGNEYGATYITDFGGALFADVPRGETVIGYKFERPFGVKQWNGNERERGGERAEKTERFGSRRYTGYIGRGINRRINVGNGY